MNFSWASIVRIGLVQTALGAVVVLCTATINRVMIVELSLMAMIPALLVGLYHGFQLLRPKWGHGADNHARRSPWVIGGMAILAAGTVGAAAATAWMETAFWPGLALAVLSFAMVGLGLGASATNLLALLAAHVAPGRKAAAGSLVWILMIAGLAASGITIGQVLDPYSGVRLVTVSASVAVISMTVTILALWGVEAKAETPRARPKVNFRAAVREVWDDREARMFVIFVFVAMLAYNTQDLILEPFGGHVFGMTPGESTALGGKMHAGALMGMLVVFLSGLMVRSTLLTRVYKIKGATLAHKLKRARRVLPRGIHRDCQDIADALPNMGHPKLETLLDYPRLMAAQKRAVAHLKGIDVRDMRWGKFLNFLGALAFNLILAAALFAALIAFL